MSSLISADAQAAATTREQASAAQQNCGVREALRAIHDHDKAKALRILTFSVGWQGHLEGLSDG